MIKSITDIKISKPLLLISEIRKDFPNKPFHEIKEFVVSLIKNKELLVSDNSENQEIYRLLIYSDNIVGVFKNIDEDNYTEPSKNNTELINNVLENKLGLTDSERWFNIQTKENKEYVKQLSIIFNPNLIAH
jgi:hypothetical protein